MPRWQLMTHSERPDRKLTGHFSDDDRRLRLTILLSQLVAARVAFDKAQREWDGDIAAARRDGQGRIADEKLKELAERLGPQ